MTYREIYEKLKEDDWGMFKQINYKKYLPTNAKLGYAEMLAESVCDIDEDGIYTRNLLKYEMVADFLLWKYTDVEKDSEIDVDEYDFLKEVGVIEELKQNLCGGSFYESDYDKLCSLLDEKANYLVEKSKLENSGINLVIKNAINVAIDKIVETYKTPEGKNSIKGILKDINDNENLLDTINNVVSGFGLDKIKNEIIKRLKQFEKEKKEQKREEKQINKKAK